MIANWLLPSACALFMPFSPGRGCNQREYFAPCCRFELTIADSSLAVLPTRPRWRDTIEFIQRRHVCNIFLYLFMRTSVLASGKLLLWAHHVLCVSALVCVFVYACICECVREITCVQRCMCVFGREWYFAIGVVVSGRLFCKHTRFVGINTYTLGTVASSAFLFWFGSIYT